VFRTITRKGAGAGLSDEFAVVPERHYGLFRFTPQAAEAAESRQRRREADGSKCDAEVPALRAGSGSS
jgi:hypothetical protein